MKKVTINNRNKWAIHDFAVLNQQERITGIKLESLYKLIQSKGEPIETKDPNLSGLKCLEYDAGQYVAIKHTPTKRNSFFPCMLKTYHLTEL